MSQEPGQLIANKYHLERPLARGGMGSVWVARHVELDVEVALKFSRAGDDFDSQSEQRFKREARAAAQLKSAHIVQIHDYGVDRGTPYIAMELLTGQDLSELLDARGRLPWGQALVLLGQAAKALKVVHRAGIVHRDIKPSNLFLAEHGGEVVLKMLDFGIAKTHRESSHTTSIGLLLGSPAYMSPEQARGQRVDERSDLWSLGAVFYRMLTGAAPFEGSNSGDILVRLCTEDVAPPSRVVPELGPQVDAFFERALARDREQRFASVDEFLAAAKASTSSPEGLPSSIDVKLDSLCLAVGPTPERGRTTETASLRRTEPTQSSSIATPPRAEPSPSTATPPRAEPSSASFETTQPSVIPLGPNWRSRGAWALGGGVLLTAAILFARQPPHGEPSLKGGDEATATLSPQATEPSLLPVARASDSPLPESPTAPEGSTSSESPTSSESSFEAVDPETSTPPSGPTSTSRQPRKIRPTSARSSEPEIPKPSPPSADPVFGLPLDQSP